MYSDLQADDGAELLRGDQTMPLQRWRVRQFYGDILRLFRKHKCRYLIDLGDTTDNRNTLQIPILSEVSAGLWSVNPNPICSFKLIGNHEQLYKHGGVNSAAFYWKHHYVTTDRCIVDLGRGRPVVVLASFPDNEEELAGWLAATGTRLKDRKTLLLGHFQVKGCQMSKGTSEHGLDSNMLEMFTLSLLGHVHKPQQIGQLNAHYVGSPFQQDYGEAGEDKRVGLLDLETLKLTWLRLPSHYPAYCELSAEEFKNLGELGEDRITVALRDATEAESFYADPRSSLVRPSLLHFQTKPAETRPMAAAERFDPTTLVSQYSAEHPLEGFTEAELIAEGTSILA